MIIFSSELIKLLESASNELKNCENMLSKQNEILESTKNYK